MTIFGVPIDNLSRPAILDTLEHWLIEGSFHRIATVNPEFLLLAQDNPKFREVLLSADLRIADGVGIHFPFWLSGEELIGRFPGADLLPHILEIAEREGYPVALALHEHGLSSPLQILAVIKQKYPKLKCGLYPDASILNTQYTILFCNYGAPLQEIYLESFRNKNTKISLAMGVGGAFDFLTGVIPRAPYIIRRLGFEWLWRLLEQPHRFRRIWNAVVIFPMRVLSQK